MGVGAGETHAVDGLAVLGQRSFEVSLVIDRIISSTLENARPPINNDARNVTDTFL